MSILWFWLLNFILCSFGLTQIIVYASILDPIRPTEGKLGELFHCPMCVGFWVGVILWALNGYTGLFTFDNSFVTGALLGCLSSGTSYVLSMLFGDDGLKLDHKGLNGRKKLKTTSNIAHIRR